MQAAGLHEPKNGARVHVHRERRLIQVPLTPKVFDTLLVLLENSSHVLTKKELMQQLWPDSLSKRTTSLRTSRYCGRR
jgi:DNA-binding winged helix-turn-helix (wHTH) protein